MTSHTNVYLRERYDNEDRIELETEKLKVELQFYRKRYDWLCSEFVNIIEAVKEWGFVDICVGNQQVRLVEQKDESK